MRLSEDEKRARKIERELEATARRVASLSPIGTNDDSRMSTCEYKKAWRRANRERELARGREESKRFRATNPESVRASQRKWREKNRDYFRQHGRDRYAANPEKFKAERRARYSAKRESFSSGPASK